MALKRLLLSLAMLGTACAPPATPTDGAVVPSEGSTLADATLADLGQPEAATLDSETADAADERPEVLDAGPTIDSAPPTEAGMATLVVVTGIVEQDNAPVPFATVDTLGLSPELHTSSGADGVWSLALPDQTRVLFRTGKAGFRPVQEYYFVPTPERPHPGLPIAEASRFTAILNALHVTEETTRGALFVNFTMVDLSAVPAGFGLTLGTAEGVSFVYQGSAPVPGNATNAGAGTMGVLNLPPGMVTIAAVVPSGLTCVERTRVTSARIDPQVITALKFECH